MKVLWIDEETTGLDPNLNTIVQIAGMVEIDFKIVDTFNFYCNPLDKVITQQALDITGKTAEQLMSYPHPDEAYKQLFKILGKHCNKFDKLDKFVVGGYNVKFDIDFLHVWCQERGEKYLGSFLAATTIDPMHIVSVLEYMGLEDLSTLPNRKLLTLCNHFGIPLDGNAHDAAYDIEATRNLAIRCIEKLEGIR